MRDLPGGRRFTPVSSAISQHVSVSAASPQMAQSHLQSPHLPSYPPAYVSSSNGPLYAPALASPSGNYHANTIFLEEENRQLKSKLAALNENTRKVDFLQKSLDHVQVKITNQQMRALLFKRAYRQKTTSSRRIQELFHFRL